MTEKLFNALKAIETLHEALGTIKVYKLPSGQGLDSLNIPAVQALSI